MQYRFESGLSIHEIKKLYGAANWNHYLQSLDETARGIANSTLLTARTDEGALVGLIRGVSDMHTILFIQDLIVLPDYQHQGIGHELLAQFDDYFKQVARIVVACDNPQMQAFFADADFLPEADTPTSTFIRPRRLLEPRY
ncbi:MAG: GNAT family N-acetyltransferase [Lactobacillus sp.]|nr:GNAT family N-acetyltransferase [Lactobacillus sp.]MCI2032882.1 GNAT family N-acetyltransferase [Lactobacillus sp.]